ncbi:MAG: NAD(P)-dependent oxidoreductase [Candidatus Nanoarchaeia archaeon]|nr:NAD(P)-dependent oxidoreductase [Candidatus Nanoarchaeia archaeon]
MKKKLLVLGAGGFIGYHITREFLKNDYEVTALELYEPKKDFFDDKVNVVIKDLSKLSDKEAIKLIKGNDYAVFAGGIDDRALPKKPSYEVFYNANVKFPVRFLTLCKKAGVKKAVILNSYFSYFDRAMPEMKLAITHPYIRSRVEQRQACLALAGKNFNVTILELPYIFGTAPGKKILWEGLIKYINSAPVIFFTSGGTAMVSVESVAKAAYNAIKYSEKSLAIPVYTENVTWNDWINRILKFSGKNSKMIIVVPKLLARIGAFFMKISHSIKGLESGLEPISYIDFQYMNSFVTDDSCESILKIKKESINDSLKETVERCLK